MKIWFKTTGLTLLIVVLVTQAEYAHNQSKLAFYIVEWPLVWLLMTVCYLALEKENQPPKLEEK